MEVTPYKDGELILVITKDNGEANVSLSSFPHCLEYVEDADNYCPIDEWCDGIANGTILVRASVERIEHINRVVNMVNETYVHKVGHVSYDEDRDCDSHSAGVERKNIVDSFFWLIGEHFPSLDILLNRTPEEILALIQKDISDSFDPEYGGTWAVMTQEAYKEEEAEKERKQLEQTASWFAHECGHPVGSKGFVIALQEAIDEANRDYEQEFSYECRSERYMACRYAGVPDSYYSDEEFLQARHNDRFNDLGRVQTWLENNCPLLMLQMREQELATA